MSIGANIKKRRYELRMSQQDLANALGYKTRSSIARIESGENDISQKKLQKFAEVLDTTVELLINGGSSSPTNRISASEKNPTYFSSSSSSKTKNVAVILAAGKSSRNQQNIPNQFINILGKPVIVYCLEAYQAHPAIDDIFIVCLKGWEHIVSAYAEQYRIIKLRGLISGSTSGILSVKNGIDVLRSSYSDNDIIIFQESTRPMVTTEMISKLLQSCSENNSAVMCQTAKDAIYFSTNGEQSQYIDRNSLIQLQSPDAYRFGFISQVFDEAIKADHPLTESCCPMLVYNMGYPINFCEGGINNTKLVRQEDIAVCTALLAKL